MSHSNTDNLFGPNPWDNPIYATSHDPFGIDTMSIMREAEERKRAHREAMEAKYPPNLGMKFRQMDELCNELGAEAFKDMAPQMYGIYKEMKTIRDFQKMAKLLED